MNKQIIFVGQIAIGFASVAAAWALVFSGHPWFCVPFGLLAGGCSGALMSEWGWRR